jgi:hypothetical protein
MTRLTNHSLSIDADLWTKFGTAVGTADDADLTRSRAIRQWLRFYVGESDSVPALPRGRGIELLAARMSPGRLNGGGRLSGVECTAERAMLLAAQRRGAWCSMSSTSWVNDLVHEGGGRFAETTGRTPSPTRRGRALGRRPAPRRRPGSRTGA